MERETQLLWMNLFLFLNFITQSVCQPSLCAEFHSPVVIQTFGTSVGTIQVPQSGRKYKSNQVCEWTLVTKNEGYGIRLDVVKCNLQGRNINGDCNNDYVDIFDYKGDAAIFKGRFCGSDKGKIYVTSGGKMTIRFYSDPFLEFSGFQAKYQPVRLGSSSEQQEEDNEKTLDMAIGIPVGLIALVAVIIVTLVIVRYCRQKKTTTRPQQTVASMQNVSPPRLGLHGGYTSSGISHSANGHNIHHGDRGVNRGRDPLSQNMPLQVAIPGSVHGGSRNERSVTPPPAYDSLDFGSDDIERSGIPLTPPPYEMIVKQHFGPSNN